MLRSSSLLRFASITWALAAVACAPMVDEARFPIGPDTVRPADLLGPFEGIVIDGDSERPVAGAVVAGTWAFERGIGLQGPLASHEVVTETGSDGRYVIPRVDELPGGLSTRVRRFTMVVYHRGHVGWRSDFKFPGRARRHDFSQLANRVRLDKWQPGYSHHEHLVFLGGGPRVRAAAQWEVQLAVMELEGERAALPGDAAGPAPVVRAPLDVSRLLSADEIRAVTGYVGRFDEGKLTDLPTTEFYDSRHFKAHGKPESFDVGLRVWRLGGAAAEAQYRKLLAELPNAKPIDEIGDQSLRASAGQIAGLAFLDRERGIVVSITCGTNQCTESVHIAKIAKLVESRLAELPAAPPSDVPAAEGAQDKVDEKENQP